MNSFMHLLIYIFVYLFTYLYVCLPVSVTEYIYMYVTTLMQLYISRTKNISWQGYFHGDCGR